MKSATRGAKAKSPVSKKTSTRTSKRSATSKAPARLASRRAPRRPKTDQTGEQKKKVDAYVAARPRDVQRRLRHVRALILAVAPGAVEWFSYGIPGFRLRDRPFIWYAAFASHVSLFPMTGVIRTTFAKDLEGLETSKGTIRFPLDQPLPDALIKRLVKARVAEM